MDIEAGFKVLGTVWAVITASVVLAWVTIVGIAALGNLWGTVVVIVVGSMFAFLIGAYL